MASNAAGTSNPGSGADGDAPRRNRPKYSKFTQQELPACKPILTPKWVVSVFFLVGIIFVAVGVVSLLAARDVVEIIDRYDHACVPPNMTDNKLGYIQNETISKDCTRTLTVSKDMKQPIFVYYQLDNFYQNHRRYVKSRNDAQLRDYKKANQTTSCEPERFTADGKPIVPCGLIAWSLFNDAYRFFLQTPRGNSGAILVPCPRPPPLQTPPGNSGAILVPAPPRRVPWRHPLRLSVPDAPLPSPIPAPPLNPSDFHLDAGGLRQQGHVIAVDGPHYHVTANPWTLVLLRLQESPETEKN